MNIIEKLKKYGQIHLIQYIDELNDTEKQQYLEQLEEIDYELIQNAFLNREIKTLEENYYKPIKSDILNQKEKIEYLNMGLQAIKNHEVACFLVAGGQGSRLGFDGPKGILDINLPSHKSLFQIYTEKLINLYHKTKVYIPFYIMTSEENNEDTMRFFQTNDYFGYNKDFIKFFKQSSLPAFNLKGEIILKDKNKVNFSSDGNGGCFNALKKSNYLADMIHKNIKWVFLFGVDNSLCKVCDPIFIGYSIKNGVQAYSKVVKKVDENEKVGILCKKNDFPTIVEYSEISDEMRNLRDSDNQLVYQNASILNHVLHIDFIKKVASKGIPLHLAFKKIESIDELGNKIVLERENGYKIEYFLFDTFKYLADMKVLEVLREEEFAPIKNKEFQDSPITAKSLILNLHKKWLMAHNIKENYELDFKEVMDFYDLDDENIDFVLKKSIKY